MPAASPKIAAVVLAAGSASRMGGRPKCLLELEGQPLIRRLLQALLLVVDGPVVLVLGHYAEAIAPAVQGLAVQVVHNPAPEAGQESSLRLGLLAVAELAQGVLVALADQPLVGVTEISDLLQAWAQRPAHTDMVVPRVNGQPGNPVVFSPAVVQDLLAAAQPMAGRQWQQAHPQRLHRWDSSNPHYCTDVDTPQDIDMLASQRGLQLQWPR